MSVNIRFAQGASFAERLGSGADFKKFYIKRTILPFIFLNFIVRSPDAKTVFKCDFLP